MTDNACEMLQILRVALFAQVPLHQLRTPPPGYSDADFEPLLLVLLCKTSGHDWQQVVTHSRGSLVRAGLVTPPGGVGQVEPTLPHSVVSLVVAGECRSAQISYVRRTATRSIATSRRA